MFHVPSPAMLIDMQNYQCMCLFTRFQNSPP